ncbi:MAG: Hpt domain-containing protein [Pseudomonadota bacterium]
MGDAIDSDVLETLKDVMEDEFDSVLSDYLGQCDQLWAEIRQQHDSREHDELRRAAHTFKGSCMSVGAEPLRAHMAALEAAAAAQNDAEAARIIADAESELARVVDAIQGWRA